MNYEVLSYTHDLRDVWNELNAAARNGHFLFDRGFMEYHADRFHDASCVVFADQEPVALFPADRRERVLRSHGGLTFGGLLLSDRTGTPACLNILTQIAQAATAVGAREIVYKALPHIYHRRPAQEDLYALNRLGAVLLRREVSTAIDYRAPGTPSTRRMRGKKKADKAKLRVVSSNRWRDFWKVLTEVLMTRHDTRPVHSVEEIESLAGQFPERIQLFVALNAEDVIVAGVVMFRSDTVAHAQYIAAGEEGRESGALDALFSHLINHYSESARYFDFGISTEQGGSYLNEGLLTFKEEFGGTAIVHDQYTLRL